MRYLFFLTLPLLLAAAPTGFGESDIYIRTLARTLVTRDEAVQHEPLIIKRTSNTRLGKRKLFKRGRGNPLEHVAQSASSFLKKLETGRDQKSSPKAGESGSPKAQLPTLKTQSSIPKTPPPSPKSQPSTPKTPSTPKSQPSTPKSQPSSPKKEVATPGKEPSKEQPKPQTPRPALSRTQSLENGRPVNQQMERPPSVARPQSPRPNPSRDQSPPRERPQSTTQKLKQLITDNPKTSCVLGCVACTGCIAAGGGAAAVMAGATTFGKVAGVGGSLVGGAGTLASTGMAVAGLKQSEPQRPSPIEAPQQQTMGQDYPGPRRRPQQPGGTVEGDRIAGHFATSHDAVAASQRTT